MGFVAAYRICLSAGRTSDQAVVWDIAVDLVFVQILHVRFVGKAGVGGHDRAGLINIVGDAQLFIAMLNGLQHRL